jgi:predicted ester cyclase
MALAGALFLLECRKVKEVNSMSTSKNKANVRRLSEEVFNKGNQSVIPDLISPNYVFHTTPELKGLEGFKQLNTTMKTAFPDYHETINHIIAEGDMVVVFYTMNGTFKGEMAGIAPTGKKFTLTCATLSRFEDGKQVEAWPYYDTLTWYRQLGIPIPAQ